jgi:mRNA interferase RelE/StbE
MQFIFTERFRKSYKKLSKTEQETLHRKLDLMSKDPYYPSLRTKKVQGTEDVFECSVTMSIRMTWQYADEAILLRVVGNHDEVLKNP